MNITQKLVSKFAEGRNGNIPKIIVIHIAECDYERAWRTFNTEEKSSHYFIRDDGSIYNFVLENNTAWGNGIVKNPTNELVKQFIAQKTNINAVSISIENEGFGDIPITPIQYRALAELVSDIAYRWKIPLDRKHIIRHNEIRADKTCPGKINIDLVLELAQNSAYKDPQLSYLSFLLENLKSQVLALFKGRDLGVINESEKG